MDKDRAFRFLGLFKMILLREEENVGNSCTSKHIYHKVRFSVFTLFLVAMIRTKARFCTLEVLRVCTLI